MVERSEIDQMAKFMSALNGGIGLSPASNQPKNLAENAVAAPKPMVGDANIAEMKTILERFYGAADNLIGETPYDRTLKEALETEPTDHGARIGSWEIQVKESGRRKLYDVVNVFNREPLACDLMLYEAAHGIVRILNNGGRINSYEAIELMRAEQDYAGSVHDMALFKHRLMNNAKSPRVHIFEARYGDAKRRALAARDRVTKLSEGR